MNMTRLVFSAAVLLAAITSASIVAVAAQDANLVRVNVVVTESSRDRMVRGLEKENFQIWEDDVLQAIVSVTAGSAAGEYVLAYKSTNTAKDGQWRKLRANVASLKGLDGSGVTLSVRFQSGYYAPSN